MIWLNKLGAPSSIKLTQTNPQLTVIHHSNLQGTDLAVMSVSASNKVIIRALNFAYLT